MQNIAYQKPLKERVLYKPFKYHDTIYYFADVNGVFICEIDSRAWQTPWLF